MQDKNMPLNLIPAAGMKFTSYDNALEFYNTYARYARFGIPKRAKHRINAYIVCSREGTHKQTVSDYHRNVRRHQKGLAARQRLESKRGRMANL